MARLDPQAHFRVPAGKQFHILVSAGRQNQAQINQWRDLTR